jgi:hypothetical protein
MRPGALLYGSMITMDLSSPLYERDEDTKVYSGINSTVQHRRGN